MLELNIDAFDNFECIGSECEDHCCRDWSITIDKDTYDKYKKEEHEGFKKMFEFFILKNKYATKNNYATMLLSQNGECFFLDSKKLCSIYTLLGPENMCTTCKKYPRYSVNLDDIIQNSISLSCPEACRKVLLRKNAIEFNLIESNILSVSSANKFIGFNQKGCFSKDLFLELRSFTIGLLQNRDYTIEERLIILGLFIEDIKGQYEKNILEIIEKYNFNIAMKHYKGIIDNINTDNMIDIEIKYGIKTYLKVISQFKSTRLKENMINMGEGLNLKENIDFEEFKTNYINIKEKYYKPFIENYEYVFENYLVSYAFKNVLMYSKKNVLKDYAEMLMYYSMIKFAIIGVCGNLKEDMDESNLILTISTFSRGVEHNKNNVEKLKELVKEFKLDNLSNLLPLILM